LHLEPLEDRWCPSSSYAITDLGTLGGASSGASAVNNVGQVAGGATTAAGANHAFLWTAGATNGVPGNPQMQDLGTLPGFPNSQASALNNAGQVAGQVSDASGSNVDAFYWNGTAMQDLGTLGGTYTLARALNNAGNGHPVQVVGQSWTGALNPDGSRVTHAFLWQNGAMTDLNNQLNNLSPNSGWVFQGATGINDNQQVVGFGTHNGLVANWLWQFGSSALPTDLGGGNFPYAVNNASQVAGVSEYTVPYHGFLWTNGSPVYLPLLPRTQSDTSDYAVALNNSSPVQVVGYTLNHAGSVDDHALLWQNGSVIDLIKQIPGSAGWSQLHRATGVNDLGQIAGSGTLTSGAAHAFLLTHSPGGRALTAAALPRAGGATQEIPASQERRNASPGQDAPRTRFATDVVFALLGVDEQPAGIGNGLVGPRRAKR
jgi:probable HAF family extracellular repeat protein